MDYRKKHHQSVQYSLNAKLTFNISIVGKKSVGKSSLIIRQIKDTYGKLPKISQGFQFYSKTYKGKSDQISVQIWDTAGKSQYNSMTRNFFRQAAAIILVYDTIEGLQQQIDALKKQLDEFAHQGVKICLARSKTDLKPISQQQQQTLKTIMQQKFPKTIFHQGKLSSKTNQNVHQYFKQLISKMNKCYQEDEVFRQAVNPQKDSFVLNSVVKEPASNRGKNKKCC